MTTGDSDERKLFRSWCEDRDDRARQQLAARYLPLAYKLASRYRHSSEPIDDLRQVAAVGLVKALDRYDPDQGVAFSTYAVPTILGELRRHFRDHAWSVHVNRGTKELALKVRETAKQLEQAGERVTVPRLADALGVTFEQVIDALNASDGQHALSFDTPAGAASEESQAPTLGDRLAAPEPGFADVEVSDTFARATEQVSERDRLTWRLYHEGGFSQSEIAVKLGVSQMQVSRILSRTAERLRSNLSSSS